MPKSLRKLSCLLACLIPQPQLPRSLSPSLCRLVSWVPPRLSPEGQRFTDPAKNKPRECGAVVQWGPVPTDGFRAGSGFAGGRPRDARQASGEGKLIGTWLRSTLAACDTVSLVGVKAMG